MSEMIRWKKVGAIFAEDLGYRNNALDYIDITIVNSPYGKSAVTNGITSNIEVTNDIHVEDSPSYTFLFKGVKSTQTGTIKYLLDSLSGRFVLAWCTTSAGQIGFYDGSWKNFGLAPNDGEYHDLAFVFDSDLSEAKLYIDGVKFGSTLSYVDRNISGSTRVFGHYSLTGNFWEGECKDFIIFNRVLTEKEITDFSTNSTFDYDKNIVSNWTMDDTSLITDNGVLGDNEGTVVGSPTVVNTPIGVALDCDGSNDWITVDDDPSLNFDLGSFSVVYYGQFNDDTNRDTIFNKGIPFNGGVNAGYELAYRGDLVNDPILWGVNDDDTSNFISIAYNTGGLAEQFRTIAGTIDRDNGIMQLFVDGECVATEDSTPITSSTSNTDTLYLGASLFSGREFAGVYGKAIILNTALTCTQIKDLRNRILRGEL